MMKLPKTMWQTILDGFPVGEFTLINASNDEYICPSCGGVCIEWQGQIDQGFQGDAIYGWALECHACGICTPAYPFD